MRDEIVKVIAEYLDVPPETLVDHATMEDLNIDSLDFVEIMFEIEEKLDAPVIFEMQDHKDEMLTLGDVLRLTEQQIAAHRAASPAAGAP